MKLRDVNSKYKAVCLAARAGQRRILPRVVIGIAPLPKAVAGAAVQVLRKVRPWHVLQAARLASDIPALRSAVVGERVDEESVSGVLQSSLGAAVRRDLAKLEKSYMPEMHKASSAAVFMPESKLTGRTEHGFRLTPYMPTTWRRIRRRR